VDEDDELDDVAKRNLLDVRAVASVRVTLLFASGSGVVIRVELRKRL
jgi:hypothetical protein